MRIHSKLTLASTILLMALPLAFAQNSPQQAQPPSPQPGTQRFRQHPMPPMAEHGQWRHNNWRRARWHERHNRGLILARLVRNPNFREKLGITPEQAQKIETRTFDFQKARIQNRADMAEKRLELKNQLLAESPNRGAIDKTLAELSAARLAQEKSVVNFHLDMRAALTPDQWQKLRQMRREFRHRGFRPHGPNGFGPNGPGSAPAAPGTNG